MRTTEMEKRNTLMFLLLLSSVAAAHHAKRNITVLPVPVPVPVGVILDLETLVGKMSRTSINMAWEDFYAINKHYSTKLDLRFTDSKDDDLEATFAALNLLRNDKTIAIIGPQKSSQAVSVSEIGSKSQVPVISFSATSPTLSSVHVPYFIRTAISDADQVYTITALIKLYGWREVVPICEDTDFGRDIVPYLADELNKIDVRIPYRSLITESSTDDQIQKELYKLQTMQTRVFIVHMTASKGATLFLNAEKVGMMSKEYVWIMTNELTNVIDFLNPSATSAMKGALGVRQYVPKKELENFAIRWRKKFQEDSPKNETSEISGFALWAYDTIHALATAVENIWIQNANFAMQFPMEKSNSIHLPVFPDGPKLLNAISHIKFRGLSGDFVLKDRQLECSVFEIINVVKGGIREIGYLRSGSPGLIRQVVASNEKNFATSSSDLSPVIWPGESNKIPKGWVLPVSGRKLRVGVINSSHTEFMAVDIDPVTNAITPSGYSVDVFEAAIKRLPYAVLYEYELFGAVSQAQSLTYNDFVYQVYLQKYDVIIGDITIRYNRMLYADFSVPYTESGVALIVPVKEDENKNKLFFFLRPLTGDLWGACLLFFVCTGIVISILEPEMRPPLNSIVTFIGTIVYISVFGYQGNLQHIQSKIIAVVWAFHLLVLASSYTASLSSMLTVQHYQPTITDFRELIKNGDYVGYRNGSFVEGLLQQLGFEKSKIRSYDIQNFDEALKKGKSNDGVVAIVDETPYALSFIAKHCKSYTMVGIYKSAGFGFAFPKGSPLVPDFSKAIVNITNGEAIIEIEKKWIGDRNCQSESTLMSNSLSILSFRGPLLLTAVVYVITILHHIFLGNNLAQRQVRSHED